MQPRFPQSFLFDALDDAKEALNDAMMTDDRPQPIVAALNALTSDEPDYTDAVVDLEPSYYEESMARKTGISVEQLRKEQEEADRHAQ